MTDLGQILLGGWVVMVILGAALCVAGGFLGKVPWIGRLPGDIYIERGNFRFYFPLAPSILVSILLTLLFMLIGRRGAARGRWPSPRSLRSSRWRRPGRRGRTGASAWRLSRVRARSNSAGGP